MRHLLETDYTEPLKISTYTPMSSKANASNTDKGATRSKLDADFDDEEETDADELERYISEKPANKEMDVLAWWKVNAYNQLIRAVLNYC